MTKDQDASKAAKKPKPAPKPVSPGAPVPTTPGAIAVASLRKKQRY